MPELPINGAPTQPLEQFEPGTTREEASALICTAYSAAAKGWAQVYARRNQLLPDQVVLDLNAIVRDAGTTAVQLQREIVGRMP